MGEVLMNSISFTSNSNGVACNLHSSWLRFHSDIKTNRRCARMMHELNMVLMFEKRPLGIEIPQPRTARMNSLYGFKRKMDNFVLVPNVVCSVETGLVCEEEEGKALIGRGEEEFESHLVEHKLPPWGDLAIRLDSDFEAIDASQPLAGLKETAIKSEHKVHFLEERDERILSERITRLSRSNKVRSALELFRSMEVSDLQPNVHACNSLLSCLLRNELLDEALRLFEFMKKNGNITGHSYSLILKAVANAHSYDLALKMFGELEGEFRWKKDFDVVVYNTMISICGRVGDWVKTEKIWASMKENGHFCTKITYRLLVSIFVRCGQNELAIDAYNEMVQNEVEAGEDVMQAIIGACSKEGKWELALSVFEDMLSHGLKPNSIACNALINSLGKGGEVKLALKVYDAMESLCHTPDAYTWNALLGALYKSNQYANGLQLFDTISRKHSSQLNLHLYNNALMSCQKLRLWDKALQILWQIEASGITVPTASYNLVIGACETARKPRVALQVYEHMAHQKCRPDTFTYLSLIRACVWGSLWEELEEILSGVTPDASIYNAVIQGMCLRGKIDSAKKLYTKMRKSGLKPDGKTRALMLQNLPKDKRKRRT